LSWSSRRIGFLAIPQVEACVLGGCSLLQVGSGKLGSWSFLSVDADKPTGLELPSSW